MGRVSLPPPVCDTSLSQRLSFENNNSNNNLREASFSSYLNHAEKEFVRKLAESARDRPSATQEEDGDIEVFGAEKYFNGGMDNNPNPNPLKLRPRRQHLSLHQKRPKSSRSGTPSVRSESSWNSQNALLQNVRRNHSGPGESKSKSKRKNKSSRKPKGFLYKCSCCDKDSVEVDSSNDTKINAKQKTTSRLAEPKKFPPKMKIEVEVEQQAQKSIEVFGSSPSLSHLERRLSMLAWNDAVPTSRVKESDSNNNSDAESDASSDLFEIESLRGNPNPFLVRQGSDCTDCVTPSEASIEWSVVTTSPVRNISAAAAEEIQRRRSNLLKAEVWRRSEPFGRMTRFEAETKVMGFASNSIARRYSPQMSNVLYV